MSKSFQFNFRKSKITWWHDISYLINLLTCLLNLEASLVAQSVKNLPAVQDTCVWLLIRKIPWRWKWQPTPAFLPGKSYGQRSLWATVQFSSVTQSCPTLCNPMDCSTPGFPVHHQLLELTQTHVHSVSDAIQPSHPLLLLPSIFTKIWVFFKWIRSSHQVAKVLEFQLQHQSFQKYLGLISFRMGCWVSLLSKGLSRVFSNTTVQKHQFFCAQLSLEFNSHIHTRLLEKS